MNTHTIFHRHFYFAVVSVSFLGWVSANTPLIQPKESKNTQIHYTPEFFRLVTMGYWPAAVEGLWISTLQEIGQKSDSSQSSSETAEKLRNFYDLATDLDPYFYEMYEQAGIHFSFFNEDGKRASHFLEKGIQVYDEKIVNHPSAQFKKRFWDHPYSLYIYLAYTQAFDLQDWFSAKATYLKAAEVPGAPAYLQSMKVWLKEEGSEKKLGIKILNLLIKNTQDETVKEKYRFKLNQLERGQSAE